MSLATLDRTFRFIHDTYDHQAPLPASVHRGLRHVRALLQLFRCSVHRPWSRTIHCPDASPFGVGVCARTVPAAVARDIGVVFEKWRFVFEDAIKARSHASGPRADVTSVGVDNCEPGPPPSPLTPP